MRGSCSPRKLGLPPSLLLRCSQSLQQTWLVGPLTDDTELTKERSHQRRNHDRREHRNFCGVCFPKSGDIRSERRRLSYYSCAARCSCTGARRSNTPDFLPPILPCLDSFRSIGVSTSSVNLEKGVLFLATGRKVLTVTMPSCHCQPSSARILFPSIRIFVF